MTLRSTGHPVQLDGASQLPYFPPSTFPTSQPLVEPLTNRVLEILDLVAQRLRNKEIAAKLFILPETIKKHLNYIYRKLNVTGRRRAAERAAALGILTRR